MNTCHSQPKSKPPQQRLDCSADTGSEVCAGPQQKCRTLSLQNLGLAYGKQWAFRHIDLDIPSCAVTAIVGPSGCGKSSLLSCINRLDEEQYQTKREGQITVGDQSIHHPSVKLTDLRKSIGMIFQRPTPFPLSVSANMDLPLREHGIRSKMERADKIEVALRSVGLWDEVKDRMSTPASQLSGGQQQRLCLARCLVLEPDTLLLDEPCSALDPLATEVIEDLILSLRGFYTIVLVTHDLKQAERLAQHVAVMWPSEEGGQLVHHGGTELLRQEQQGEPELVRKYLEVGCRC